jgi:hypothetical protein
VTNLIKNAQHQLKIVTAKVDVSLSKASRAMDAKKFLLEEIESLGKAMKCESFALLIYFFSMFARCDTLPVLQMRALTAKLKPGA